MKNTPVKEGYKLCSKCNKELPNDSKHFVSASNTKSGLGAMCKKCKHEKYIEKREYYLEKSRKYYAENKEAIIEKSKEYRDKNKEHKKEYDKKYYKKNRDKKREYDKKYYAENKEKLNQYNKIYYQDNKESIKEINKKWKLSNPDKVKLTRKRRRNKSKELVSDLTLDEWNYIKMYFNNECAYCGEKCDLEQDHFIPVTKGGGYTKSNIIPACRSCNASKNNNDFYEWYSNKNFYSKDREEYIRKYLREAII